MIDDFELGKFLSDGQTHKIIEAAYHLNADWDELLVHLELFKELGLLEYGGYSSDPTYPKFVRLLRSKVTS